MTEINWGPSGETVFKRTYSRPTPNGERETWPMTVGRVAKGNMALVYGDDTAEWTADQRAELADLTDYMLDFRVMPAGRHYWASGIKGRQYLMNCWTSGWTEKLSEHFEFTFLRLMEGGGVGANYSSEHLVPFGLPRRVLNVHIVCDPDHDNYEEMLSAGVLSDEYTSDWDGAFEVADSREGWASALTDLIDTFMTGNHVKHSERVYDVTNVRPRGARLKTFGGTASGPAPFATMMNRVAEVLSMATYNAIHQRVMLGLDRVKDAADYFSPGRMVLLPDEEMEVGPLPSTHLTPVQAMQIDHAIAECVVSGGVRRSARMSIVRWEDPFISEFLACKADGREHWTTNISVEVDTAFFQALADEYSPSHEAAVSVHQAVMQGALTNGEPGYWNSTLSNHGEITKVYATNPCGEIVLHEFEPCCLTHVNLDAFAPKDRAASWDEGGMIRAHELATRFALRATFGDINDEKSRSITNQNRRIGIGHLGVQGFITKRGFRYSEAPTAPYLDMPQLLGRLKQIVRNTARQYAFMLRIPEPVKVTTVAPTGSIAKLPGVPEGIHPILFRFFEQRIRFAKSDADQFAQVVEAEALGYQVEVDTYDPTGNTLIVVYPTKNLLVEQVEALGYEASLVEEAGELTVDQMLSFQRMYQEHYADNAVSFTVNVPAEPHQQEYMLANPGGMGVPAPSKQRVAEVSKVVLKHLPYLKGTTIMVDGARVQAPYTKLTREEYEATQFGVVGDDIDLDCATGACPIR